MLRSPPPSRTASNAPDWSLFMPDVEDEYLYRKTKLWSGKAGSCPSPTILSEMISTDMSDVCLEDLAGQVCKNAPINSIPGLLSCLSCNYWRNDQNNNIDIRRLQALADTANRSVCGYVFNQGDIVWTCRQCAKDPTCVQCDKCFRKSDHEGHEVYFHRASGGGSGCCDCGDEEAWSRVGNCLDHNHPSCDCSNNKDPLENVPPELLRGLRAVAKGSIGVVISYIICTVRGYCPLESNSFIQEFAERNEPIVARLHNDDHHTYDDVILALNAAGLASQSDQITFKVDKEGEGVVATEPVSGIDRLRAVHQKLSTEAGLLFSLAPQSVVSLEPRVAAVFAWIQSLGGMSDGLRRVFAEMLFSELDSAVHCFPVEQTATGETTMSQFLQRECMNAAYSPVQAFALREQFPSVLLHLYAANKPLPSIPLVAPVYCTETEASRLKRAAESQPEETDLTQPNAPKEPQQEYETDYKKRLQHPFDQCHRDSLSIMLLGTPYLPVSIKKCVNDLIMEFQHDLMFKACFSQQVTLLYPALNVLFCRGIGTAENTVFHTTVQVYTANSVVTMMSSDGVGTVQRRLPEGPRPAVITSLLAATLMAVLLDTGCEPVRRSVAATGDGASNGAFLMHHSIRTQRLSHLCRDLEYLSADFGFCTRLLCEDVDRGMLDIWVDICTMLQCLDSYTRMVDAHVEREDDHWQDAANLILELESVSSNFIARALLDQVFADQRAALATSTRATSASNAPAYTAPIVSPYDKAQFPLMRGKAVALITQKALQAITAWVQSLPLSAGPVSSLPKRSFLGGAVSPFHTVTQGVVYPVPDLRGVASLPMSVHLPLNRLFAKLIHFGACGGADLSSAIVAFKGLSSLDATLFVEHPLRCLVFAAQVSAGMWRRNGYTVLNLAYNYGRAPLSKTMRDMDILAVQLSASALGCDAFVATLTSRFQVLSFLEAAQDPRTFETFMSPAVWMQIPASLNILEHQPALLAELLKLLIIALTYAPVCLLDATSSERPTEGWKRTLKREIVHQLLTGVQSAGQLQKVKVMVGSTRTVSDAMLQVAIEETCVRRADEEDSVKVLSLRPESYAFFDPEFPSLPNQAQSTACDRIREHMKSEQSTRPVGLQFSPLVHSECLPIPHESFGDLRSVLYCPAMMRLLATSLTLKPYTLAVLGRVIHLVTLQVGCCECADANAALEMPYFRDAFSPASKSDTNNVPSVAFPLQSVVTRGSGRQLLSALADLWTSGEVRDDILYHQGLGWVLQQISMFSPDGRELLASKGVSFGTTSGSATDPSTPAGSSSKGGAEEGDTAAAKLAKQKAAQLRAIEEANKRAAAAFAAFGDDMSDDEDEDQAVKTTAEGEEDLYAEETVPECIICREKTNSPVGYLCFLQPSNVLRNAHLTSPDSEELMNVFRVVAFAGVNVHAEPQDDAAVLHILPQGEHIHVENRDGGRWLKLRAPHTGWCSLYCNADDAPLAAGQPTPLPGNSKTIVNLHPVAELQFAKHGGTRLHASACGHTMHFDCWDMFFAANYARYTNNHRSAELLAVDVERGESLCPLCKSVTNTLLPFTSRTPCRPGSEGNNLLPAQCPSYCRRTHEAAEASSTQESFDTSKGVVSLRNVHDKPLEESLSELLGLFGRDVVRTKLTSDALFYDSCTQQAKMPWDADTYSEPGLSRNLSLLRNHHAMWSATAYTLLTATCNRIRERNVFTPPTAGATVPTSVPLQLLESDMSMLRHLLSLVWRSPAWMRYYYYDFVSKPLHAMLIGTPSKDHNSTPTTKKDITSAKDQFLNTHSVRTWSDLQRSLLSVPYESVPTSLYPSARLIGKMTKLATEIGVPEQDAWAALRVPLLSQDLHVIAVAAAANAVDLASFLKLNQIICVAKLAQALLEPVANGQVDYFHQDEDRHAKSGSSGPPRRGVKADAKHTHAIDLSKDDKDRESAPSKRSKTSYERQGAQAEPSAPRVPPATAAPALSPLDASISGLMQLRELVCRAAGVPLSRGAPLGWNLLAIVLDSWIPFLEYAYYLRSLMHEISGIRAADGDILQVPLNSASNAISSNLRHDANHQHLAAKFNHVSQLLVVLDLPSIDLIAASPFYCELFARWGGHFLEVQQIIEGVDDGATGRLNSTTLPPASPFIPTAAPLTKSPVSGKKSLKSSGGTHNAPTSHDAGRVSGSSNSSSAMSALDAQMWNMLNNGILGPNQGLSHRPHHHERHQSPDEADDEEEQRMADAMEVNADVPPGVEDEDMDSGSSDENSDDGNDYESESDDMGRLSGYPTQGLELYLEGGGQSEDEDGEEEHSFYSAEEHEYEHEHYHNHGSDEEGGGDEEEEEEEEHREVWSDADEFFGAEAFGPAHLDGVVGDTLPLADGTATGQGSSAAGKRAPLIWKLHGVYPINASVDAPAPELSTLAAALGEERNSPTSNLLQLMPVRAPLQGSVSGTHSVVGFNGPRCQYIFPDLSHMGVGLRHLGQVFITLPTIYTDLYQLTKFTCEGGGKKAVDEPAMCLVCGRILNAGNKKASGVFTNAAGECTIHARSCGAGLGVYFLVQQCQVLLIRGSRGTYWPSLYLDASGEVNEQRGQNRPLFLSAKRYKKLEELYVNHQVSKEIVRKRSSAETVIRMDWF